MAKPEWGAKRTCQGCAARFYDLQRQPIVCPVCEAVFDPERQPKARRASAVLRDEPAAPKKVVDDEATAEDAADDEEDVGAEDADVEDLDENEGKPARKKGDGDNEDLIEDTSELGEDDDDIGEVIEHIDEDAEDKA